MEVADTSTGGGLVKDPSRADVVNAVLKTKGVNNIDDLDDVEPLLELQGHHELIVIVEMCEAERPSRLGSLKGSHRRYEEEYGKLEESFQELSGSGVVVFQRWEPPTMTTQLPILSRPPSRPQSAGTVRTPSRPQSAAMQPPRLRAELGLTTSPERSQPRIGAFEVSIKLINKTSGVMYGSVEIFSKIKGGRWPGKLLKRAQEHLQPWLKADIGNHIIYGHVQSEISRDGKDSTKTGSGPAGASPSTGSTPTVSAQS